MKNKKLNLSDLKVKSFVTDLENEKSETAKGGRFSDGVICDSREPEFCNWTYNRWCYGSDNTIGICTAPK